MDGIEKYEVSGAAPAAPLFTRSVTHFCVQAEKITKQNTVADEQSVL